MENFSAIIQTVWRPAQKNSWGGGLHQPPPDRARVNDFDTIVFLLLRRVEPYIKWLWKVKVKVWPQVKTGQGHLMTEMGHIAYQSIRLAETNVLTPIPRLYHFLIKSNWQMTVGDLGWPQMTLRGVGNANFNSNCPQLSYTIWLHSNRLAPK